jgi:choline kinase
LKAIILAAGIGSRLGMGLPKALVTLEGDRTILDVQLDCLRRFFKQEDIYIVVGFRKELIIDRYPELTFIYNDSYGSTNTSKSLLRGLKRTGGSDTLWVNGDVYFTPEVLARVARHPRSCVAVNTSRVAEEEVKYKLNSSGTISELSKAVKGGLGEAVGINKVTSRDLPILVEGLENCLANDYFEAGIERILDRAAFHPVDVTGLDCIEVDFTTDLHAAREMFSCGLGPVS